MGWSNARRWRRLSLLFLFLVSLAARHVHQEQLGRRPLHPGVCAWRGDPLVAAAAAEPAPTPSKTTPHTARDAPAESPAGDEPEAAEPAEEQRTSRGEDAPSTEPEDRPGGDSAVDAERPPNGADRLTGKTPLPPGERDGDGDEPESPWDLDTLLDEREYMRRAASKVESARVRRLGEWRYPAAMDGADDEPERKYGGETAAPKQQPRLTAEELVMESLGLNDVNARNGRVLRQTADMHRQAKLALRDTPAAESEVLKEAFSVLAEYAFQRLPVLASQLHALQVQAQALVTTTEDAIPSAEVAAAADIESLRRRLRDDLERLRQEVRPVLSEALQRAEDARARMSVADPERPSRLLPLTTFHNSLIKLQAVWEEELQTLENLLVEAEGHRQENADGDADPPENQWSAEDTEANELVAEAESLLNQHGDLSEVLSKLERAADLGHEGAVASLAALYFSGDVPGGLAARPQRAVRYLERALEAGHPDAHALAGMLYAANLSGWRPVWTVNGSAPIGVWRALTHWQVAAAGGNAYAQMALGFRYLHGYGGVAANCPLALHFYKKAAKQAALELIEREQLAEQQDNLWRGTASAAGDRPHEAALRSTVGIRQRLTSTPAEESMEGARFTPEEVYRLRRAARRWRHRRARSATAESSPPPPPERQASSSSTRSSSDTSAAGGAGWRARTVGRPGRLLRGYAAAPSLEDEIVQYYRHAADRGDPRAQLALGGLYFHGARGLPQDRQRARHYFEQAARVGDAQALVNLGYMYARGIGVPLNNQSALRYYRAAAAQYNPTALNGLAYMYLMGMGTEPNAPEALRLFRLAAERGNVEAKFNLGMLYAEGVPGVQPRDRLRALAYFAEAARHGHVLATYRAARLMEGGVGHSDCLDVATAYRRVAEAGVYGQGLVEAGRLAFDESGIGSGDERRGAGAQAAASTVTVTDALDTALWRFVQAAEAGVEVAQYNAAILLRYGPAPGDTDESGRRASRYALMSAMNGNIQAMVQVGDGFYAREAHRAASAPRRETTAGGAKAAADRDASTALRFYRKAADHGSAEAMFYIGCMYARGHGGLQRDWHLAERCWEAARRLQPAEAWLPATLAIVWARLYRRLAPWREALRWLLPRRAPSAPTASTSSARPRRPVWPAVWSALGAHHALPLWLLLLAVAVLAKMALRRKWSSALHRRAPHAHAD